MRRLAFRRALRAAALVALAVAVVTVYLFARTYAGAASGGDAAAGGWYWPLFVPAAVGFILVGGAHGDAPFWLILAACGAANGLAWGAGAFVLAYATLRGRRRRTGSQV